MLAWPRPATMRPASDVMRQFRPPLVHWEEVAAAGMLTAAPVEVEVAEAGAAVAAAEAVATALAPRARFRSTRTPTPT